MKNIEIYNLRFPDNVNELNVGGYCFTRASDYADKVKELASAFDSGDFYTSNGSHQITALMTPLEGREENEPVLPWNNLDEPKEYLDVLLTLSLLTGLNIFAKTWDDIEGKRQIIEDPRQHRGNFSRFVLPIGKARNNKTGEVISDVEMNGLSAFEWCRFDQGLEITANKVWNTLRNESWQKKYSNGAFLFIFSQSQRRQRTESTFILSWSIWEHIFSLHHSSWMSGREISKMSGSQKYKFIKHEYFSNSNTEKESEVLTEIRNRLIHFGFFPEDVNKNQSAHIANFFRDTEQLVAKILKLVG